MVSTVNERSGFWTSCDEMMNPSQRAHSFPSFIFVVSFGFYWIWWSRQAGEAGRRFVVLVTLMN